MSITANSGSLINPAVAERVLAMALSRGGEFADLYVEESRFSHLVLSNRQVHEAQPGHDVGAGVRLFTRGTMIYAYTTDITEGGLTKVARVVSEAVDAGVLGTVLPVTPYSTARQGRVQTPLRSVELGAKMDLAEELDGWARSESSRISDVRVFYSDLEQNVTVANSTGRLVSDARSRVRAYVQVVAEKNESRRLAVGPGATTGFEFFRQHDLRPLIQQTVAKLLTLQEAKPAPGGEFPVILGAGYGGLLFHEACGHCLEAEAVARGASVYRADQIGTPIASPVFTLVDDATVEGAWGSYALDDEGAESRKNTLIEGGVLTSLLVDRFNGERLGIPANGCARRQSYRYAPTSRMSNTHVMPGNSSLDEMVASVEYGMFIERIDNGMVDTASGNFTFPATVARMIRGGRLAEPVAGAAVMGNAAEVLQRVEMVGNASEMAHSVAICRAASGVIPVTFGLPPVRIQKLRVRGVAT